MLKSAKYINSEYIDKKYIGSMLSKCLQNGFVSKLAEPVCSEPEFLRLVPYELASLRSHAHDLLRVQVLNVDELPKLLSMLDQIEAEFREEDIKLFPNSEDAYMFVEHMLVLRLGKLGTKLCVGRSRADQLANALRLYLRDNAHKLALSIVDLQNALIVQAEQHTHSVMPGFTHLQPVQPVTFAHRLLAHGQAISRDLERLRDWDRRSARSPIGAAALAGSAICVYSELSAYDPGYDGPCENSIDAILSRDHIAEFIFIASLLAVDLSRLLEETTLWASSEFRWVEFANGSITDDWFAPQKKHDNIAELKRTKEVDSLIGHLSDLISMAKALPLAHDCDPSEDQRAVFDCIDTFKRVLPEMVSMMRTMDVNVDEMRRQASVGCALATEAVDWLTLRGVPLNEANHIAIALVSTCSEQGEWIDASPATLTNIDMRLEPDVLMHVTPDAAVAARGGFGGTAPVRVAEQIARLKVVTGQQASWATIYRGPSS